MLYTIDCIFFAYAICTVAAVYFVDARIAVAGTYLLGLVLLPVGNYPLPEPGVSFQLQIIGVALPAQMLITKAWVAPLAALMGGVLLDGRRVMAFRPRWCDFLMMLWVLWPLVSGLFVTERRPERWGSAWYLAGVWAAPWLLGRIWFGDEQGRIVLIRAIVLSALLLLPVALIEGVRAPTLYAMAYGYHPFLDDGIDRYIGFRPLGFFEDGNQYGIWVALAALGALGLSVKTGLRSQPVVLVAATLIVMAFASQSLGAILLLGIGAVLAWALRARRISRRGLATAGSLFLICGAVYISGVIPFQHIFKETEIGGKALDLIRQTGRGSFAWRVSQDQKALPLLVDHPVAGHNRWDWWRSVGTRPWGLAMLILGQFGAIGLLFAGAAATSTALSVFWRSAAKPFSPITITAALMVLLAAIDALLNAFIFLPAFALAGSLAVAGPLKVRDNRP